MRIKAGEWLSLSGITKQFLLEKITKKAVSGYLLLSEKKL